MRDEQRLDGWKAIGNFLGRDRTTAMRWARERGLPVHRLPGGRQGTVYALGAELEAWMAYGSPQPLAEIAATPPPPVAATSKFSWWPVLLGGAALIAVGGFVLSRRAAEPTGLVSVLVVPSSRAGDGLAEFEHPLAADLARFANASAGLAIYDASGSDRSDTSYTVSVHVEQGRNGLVAEPKLVARKGGVILWSQRVEQAGSTVSELRERVAARIVHILRCALQSPGSELPKLRPADLLLVVNSCQAIIDIDPEIGLASARQLAARRPDLATSWAMLSYAQLEMTEERDAGLMREARANAQRAAKISPRGLWSLTILAATAGDSGGGPQGLPILELARQQYPDNPIVLSQLSIALFNLGYVKASILPAMQAVRSDPSSVWKRDVAVRRLAAAGQLNDALVLQRETERLWPDHPIVIASRRSLQALNAPPAVRGDLPSDFAAPNEKGGDQTWATNGDGSELTRLKSEAAAHPYVNYILTDLYETRGDRRAALAAFAQAPTDNAHNQWSKLFWPHLATFRAEPVFFEKMARLGLVRIWLARGQWPDFCSEPALKYDCATEAARLGIRRAPTAT